MAIWQSASRHGMPRRPTAEKLDKFASTSRALGPYQVVIDTLSLPAEDESPALGAKAPTFQKGRAGCRCVLAPIILIRLSIFDPFIDEVFSELKSGFLNCRRGGGSLNTPVFETGYQALKKATAGFAAVTAEEHHPGCLQHADRPDRPTDHPWLHAFRMGGRDHGTHRRGCRPRCGAHHGSEDPRCSR